MATESFAQFVTRATRNARGWLQKWDIDSANSVFLKAIHTLGYKCRSLDVRGDRPPGTQPLSSLQILSAAAADRNDLWWKTMQFFDEAGFKSTDDWRHGVSGPIPYQWDTVFCKVLGYELAE